MFRAVQWWLFALCSRLLSQLSEKEREYQELLRNSVQRKQEQIDVLKKAAATTGQSLVISIQMALLSPQAELDSSTFGAPGGTKSGQFIQF